MEPLVMRVGDAERDACVTALIDHHLHGRLSVEELDRRQGAALAAVTSDHLAGLLADLPGRDTPEATRTRRPGLPASDNARVWALRALPVGMVVGGAQLSQWAWQFSAEGPFLGALAGGALGYATHAVINRLRR